MRIVGMMTTTMIMSVINGDGYVVMVKLRTRRRRRIMRMRMTTTTMTMTMTMAMMKVVPTTARIIASP